MEEGVKGMCASGPPGGRGQGGAGWCGGDDLPPRLDVELRDRPLSARVRVLVVDALAVALHLGQVLVEDLAGPQGRHQVVELAAVVLAVGLCFAGLALPFPLLLQLRDRGRTKTEKESEPSSFCDLLHKLKQKNAEKYSVNANADLRSG